MARVEKVLKIQQEVAELRQEVDEVEKEENKNYGRGKLKLGCFGLVLLVILFLLGGSTWCLAASGLVTVPVVSNLAYEPPQSLHQVEAGSPLDVYVTEFFSSLITDRLQSGAGTLADRSLDLSLPESSITASLRTLAQENSIDWIKAEEIQVAIEKESGVEIFIPLANQENNNAVRLLFEPGVDQGLLVLNQVKVSVGSFTFPSRLTNLMVKPLSEQGLNSLNQLIGRYALIKEIQVFDSSLEISGDLAVEIMKLQ